MVKSVDIKVVLISASHLLGMDKMKSKSEDSKNVARIYADIRCGNEKRTTG